MNKHDRRRSGRRIGTTTDQLRSIPVGDYPSIFFWCNHHLWYPREIALDLGRTVGPGYLKIMSINELHDDADQLRGVQWRHIVVDHAAEMSAQKRYAIELVKQLCAARQKAS